MPYVIRLTELRDATNGDHLPLPEGGAYFAYLADSGPMWTLEFEAARKFDTGRDAERFFEISLYGYNIAIEPIRPSVDYTHAPADFRDTAAQAEAAGLSLSGPTNGYYTLWAPDDRILREAPLDSIRAFVAGWTARALDILREAL